ncbi:hypothetical protein P8452_67344 [Trifolium repens]|nr:hypothetical protein P8452_67344 [Trifolium repens]
MKKCLEISFLFYKLNLIARDIAHVLKTCTQVEPFSFVKKRERLLFSSTSLHSVSSFFNLSLQTTLSFSKF